jgi:hypothetical protein
MQIFPEGILAVFISMLVLAPAGIIFGIVGLVKGRWPMVAIAGILLSGLLLFGVCFG